MSDEFESPFEDLATSEETEQGYTQEDVDLILATKRQKTYRKFDGKQYYHTGDMSWANKRNAEKQANLMRDRGCKARIVRFPKMNRYDVWVRCKR